jgi:hypothetical protein
MHEDLQQNKAEKLKEENQVKIYRGIWANKLNNGEELGVGGSIFSEELTTKLKLDFESFDPDLQNATEEKMRAQFEEKGEALKAWLDSINSDVDPYIFGIAMGIQAKIDALLEVKTGEEENPALEERQNAYFVGTPTLSGLKGKSACAERAALAQYVLQKMGVSSSYMSGVSTSNPEDGRLEDHSFVVIDHEGTNLIFDIARPRSGNRLPRLLKPVTPFSSQTFEGTDNLLIEAEEVLQKGKLYFGVGHQMSDSDRKIIKS